MWNLEIPVTLVRQVIRSPHEEIKQQQGKK